MPRGLISSVAALACGAALALCLPRPGLCFLAWLVLAPLMALWENASAGRRAALLGFFAGLGFHGLALHWVYQTCRFAGQNPAVGLLAWSAMSAVLALNWAAVGWLGFQLTRAAPAARRPWLWAASWTAVAVATQRWTPRLGADLLAYTQWRHLEFVQLGSWAGPHALGFLIILVNASWMRRRVLPAALVLVVLAWGHGAWLLSQRRPAAETRRVEILQPAVDQYQKWDASFAERIMENFRELLARPRAGRPDLIVWPESALPYVVEADGEAPEAASWSRALAAHQAVGALTRAEERLYNSALLLMPNGEAGGLYHKRRLVPFGEFLPLPFLARWIGILGRMGGISPGAREQPLFQTPLGPAAAGICYEALFPELARFDARRGARLLLNLTNDGWYKDTWGPHQHFWANVYRAVENRMSVIRAGNTGISAVVDPWGVVTARLDLGLRGRLDALVPARDPFPGRSFYARHGDWFGFSCVFLTSVYALYLFTRLRR